MTGIFKRLKDQCFDPNRWAYFRRSLHGCLDPERSRCPNCHEAAGVQVDRKLLVTRLMRCQNCRLQFRIPTDPPAFGETFYQDDYSQGFTTDCPSRSDLNHMLESRFHGTPKDFQKHLQLFSMLGIRESARILDFGASWGYGTWQMEQAGYQVTGYEPGRSRARYAREMLKVHVVDQVSQIDGPFDLVFSSHVLEHVPSPGETLKQMTEWLRPGGLLIAFTPNGSDQYRQKNPSGFSNHWGMVHPNYLDEQFYGNFFRDSASLMCGTPVDSEMIRNWDQKSSCCGNLGSWEILVIAVRPENDDSTAGKD